MPVAVAGCFELFGSLPVWGEGIEIGAANRCPGRPGCLSPYGERGLKFFSGEVHKTLGAGLSPYGERGLKYERQQGVRAGGVSPRMGRGD